MQSSDAFAAGSAVFDEQNPVSPVGLVPVLELAEMERSSRPIVECTWTCWSQAWACDRSRRRGCSWRTSTCVGRIVLRGKASREDGTPLPADVGEALSAHLRLACPSTGQPTGASAAVPVRQSPPATDSRPLRHLGFRRGWAGNVNLLVATDGIVVIRPNRAKL